MLLPTEALRYIRTIPLAAEGIRHIRQDAINARINRDIPMLALSIFLAIGTGLCLGAIVQAAIQAGCADMSSTRREG